MAHRVEVAWNNNWLTYCCIGILLTMEAGSTRDYLYAVFIVIDLAHKKAQIARNIKGLFSD